MAVRGGGGQDNSQERMKWMRWGRGMAAVFIHSPDFVQGR